MTTGETSCRTLIKKCKYINNIAGQDPSSEITFQQEREDKWSLDITLTASSPIAQQALFATERDSFSLRDSCIMCADQ